MALFSGSLFIAIAGRTRAHVILNVCIPLFPLPHFLVLSFPYIITHYII